MTPITQTTNTLNQSYQNTVKPHLDALIVSFENNDTASEYTTLFQQLKRLLEENIEQGKINVGLHQETTDKITDDEGHPVEIDCITYKSYLDKIPEYYIEYHSHLTEVEKDGWQGFCYCIDSETSFLTTEREFNTPDVIKNLRQSHDTVFTDEEKTLIGKLFHDLHLFFYTYLNNEVAS